MLTFNEWILVKLWLFQQTLVTMYYCLCCSPRISLLSPCLVNTISRWREHWLNRLLSNTTPSREYLPCSLNLFFKSIIRFRHFWLSWPFFFSFDNFIFFFIFSWLGIINFIWFIRIDLFLMFDVFIGTRFRPIPLWQSSGFYYFVWLGISCMRWLLRHFVLVMLFLVRFCWTSAYDPESVIPISQIIDIWRCPEVTRPKRCICNNIYNNQD